MSRRSTLSDVVGKVTITLIGGYWDSSKRYIKYPGETGIQHDAIGSFNAEVGSIIYCYYYYGDNKRGITKLNNNSVGTGDYNLTVTGPMTIDARSESTLYITTL